MNSKEYCNSLSSEIAGWRAAMYEIISHVETLPDLDRRYFSRDVNALRAIISAIEETLHELKTECPVDFSARGKAA